MLQRQICQQKNLQDVYNINHNDADILLNKCKISINMNFHIPSNHLYYEIMKIVNEDECSTYMTIDSKPINYCTYNCNLRSAMRPKSV